MSKKLLINQFKTKVASITKKCVTEHTDDIIEDLIKKDLRNVTYGVFAKILGFDNRWGKWEIDHCNGRTSIISNYINAAATLKIKEWIDNQLENLPTLSETQLNAIKKDYLEKYNRNLRELLSAAAEKKAKEDVQIILKEYTDDNNVQDDDEVD